MCLSTRSVDIGKSLGAFHSQIGAVLLPYPGLGPVAPRGVVPRGTAGSHARARRPRETRNGGGRALARHRSENAGRPPLGRLAEALSGRIGSGRVASKQTAPVVGFCYEADHGLLRDRRGRHRELAPHEATGNVVSTPSDSQLFAHTVGVRKQPAIRHPDCLQTSSRRLLDVTVSAACPLLTARELLHG
jgi:hypothetical protein